jgi:hypothetical protein
MQVEAFLLCDAATEQQGKLNVLGAFDTIYAQKIPAAHPQCAVAARIRFGKLEDGKHQLRLHVIDQDGEEIIPRLDGEISIQVSDRQESTVVNFLFHLQRIKFEKHEQYRIDLAIDGDIKASLPLFIINPLEQSR